MTSGLYVFSAFLIATTCILIFGLRAAVAWHGARTQSAREEAYRDLAAKATAAQVDAAAQLASLRSELSALSSRLAAIQTLLRSVE